MSIFCPACGARNPDNAVVCHVCGKDLSKAKSAQQAKQESSTPLILLAIAVAAIFILASLTPFIRPHIPFIEGNINQFINNALGSNGTTLQYSNNAITTTSNTEKTSPLLPTTSIAPSVYITAVNVQTSYSSNGLEYNHTQTYNGTKLSAASEFPYTLVFSNSANTSYVINSIKVGTPGFLYVNSTPALPYLIAAGSSISITSFIKSPNYSYSGVLELKVKETALNSSSSNKTLSKNATNGELWDQRIGESFAENYTDLLYNVTAIPQIDSNGCGPSYTVDGLSDMGYWYKLALSYSLCNDSYFHSPGFSVNYQVYGPSGSAIYPASGSYISMPLNGSINAGDEVLLNMYVIGSNVVMVAKDWNTGSGGYVLLDGYGANSFVGTHSPFSPHGFFTGLMTEWYHLNQYNSTEQNVTYSPLCSASCSPAAWLWIDESHGNSSFANNTVFSNSTSVAVYPYQDAAISSHKLAAYYLSNGSFITG